MTTKKVLAALACAVSLAGCGEKITMQDITAPLPEARIRFANFGVNAPGVNFYANDTKMTAIVSTTGAESANGLGFGSFSAEGRYSGIAPGQYTIAGKISADVDKDLAISGTPAAIESGKFYTFYQSGLYNTGTKKTDSFVVEDPFTVSGDTAATQVRFVNGIYNSAPMTLYAKSTVTGQEYPIGGAIAYKSAGTFVTIPRGAYDLSTRTAGSATNVIVRAAVSFNGARVYTISSRGDMTITSATPAPDRRPFLDNTSNY